MTNLIGKRCEIIFDLPVERWPVPGYPAFAVVKEIYLHMMLLSSGSSMDVWINSSILFSIKEM